MAQFQYKSIIYRLKIRLIGSIKRVVHPQLIAILLQTASKIIRLPTGSNHLKLFLTIEIRYCHRKKKE